MGKIYLIKILLVRVFVLRWICEYRHFPGISSYERNQLNKVSPTFPDRL